MKERGESVMSKVARRQESGEVGDYGKGGAVKGWVVGVGGKDERRRVWIRTVRMGWWVTL